MILQADGTHTDKLGEVQETQSEMQVDSNMTDTEPDLPPGYSQSLEQNGQASTSMASGSGAITAPNVKPSNFVRIQQHNNSVRGSWVINPMLRIPPLFLPPLAPDETEATRKNLSIESKNGSVEADVYIVPTQGTDSKQSDQRLTIYTSSSNGSVSTLVHDLPPSESGKTRVPMFLIVASRNGRVTVHLPRSFYGLINVEVKNGSIRYSPEMQASLTPLSDVNGVHRAFLGPFDPSQFEDQLVWNGDELTVTAHNGTVRLYYDDQIIPPTTNFWTRLFGQ